MRDTSSLRSEGISLLERGHTPKEVAASLGVNLATVYRWRGRRNRSEMSDEVALRAARPRALKRLISLAYQGDLRAIKEVLTLTCSLGPDPGSYEAKMQDTFYHVVYDELDQVDAFQASQWLILWFRIRDRFAQVLAGKLPPPPQPKAPAGPPCDFRPPSSGPSAPQQIIPGMRKTPRSRHSGARRDGKCKSRLLSQPIRTPFAPSFAPPSGESISGLRALAYITLSSPTVSPRNSLTLLRASSTPGMKDSRLVESWRMVSV